MHYHYFRRRKLQQLAVYIWVGTVIAFALLLLSGISISDTEWQLGAQSLSPYCHECAL